MTPPRAPRRASSSPATKTYSPQVEAILQAIRAIPRGAVAAYGEVAARAGLPRGARQVARVLHSLSGPQDLPWHRVIGRNGRISLPMDGPGALQARLLRKEGLAVDAAGRVSAGRPARGAAPETERRYSAATREEAPKVRRAGVGRRSEPGQRRRKPAGGEGPVP